jgi:hypothetical protein
MQSSILRTQAQSFSQTAGEVALCQAFAAITCSSSDSSTAPEPHSAVCDIAPIRQESDVKVVETVQYSIWCLAAVNGCLCEAVHTAAARGLRQQHVAQLRTRLPTHGAVYMPNSATALVHPATCCLKCVDRTAEVFFVLPMSFFAAAAPSRSSTVAVRATYQEDRSSRGPRGRGRFSRRCEQHTRVYVNKATVAAPLQMQH